MTNGSTEIREYLLGLLDDGPADQLGARAATDEVLFQAISATLDDICEDYACGALLPSERLRVEHLAESPIWRERLSLAIALHEVGNESRRIATLPPEIAPHVPSAAAAHDGVIPIADWFRSQRWLTRVTSIAAAIVAMLGYTVFWYSNRRLASEVTSLQGAESRQLAALTERADSIERLLSSDRARIAQMDLALQAQRTSNFSLVPVFTRSNAEELVVPPEASFVRFELALERGAPPAPYRAELRNARQQLVYSETSVLIDTAGTRPLPSMRVPASAFESGDHRLILYSVSPGGGGAPVATYAFRIVKR